MPIKRKDETPDEFVSRCMSDEQMQKEFPDAKQRIAVCISKASEGLDSIQAADLSISHKLYSIRDLAFSSKEDAKSMGKFTFLEGCFAFIDESGKEYWMPGKDFGDISKICSESYEDSFGKAVSLFRYRDPVSNEVFYYEYKGVKKRDGNTLIYLGETSEAVAEVIILLKSK